jgi:two-component system, LuxR family, response regulator FixJ
MRSDLVHVVDDDAEVRNSVAFLLRSAGMEVRTYESAAALLDKLPTVNGGCVVTDVRMPEINGLELQRRLRAAGATLPVIVITGHGDVPLAVTALKDGAVDFIEKPFKQEVLIAAVRSALQRSRIQTDEAGQKAGIAARLALLTPRERQILEGIVAGKPNKVTARELGISPRTVEVYRANVMTKMEAGSVPDLVRMALAGGIRAAEPH